MPLQSQQTRRWMRLAATGLMIPLLLAGIVLLGLDVRARLKALQSAVSDNAQWVVLQSEVETLKLMMAVNEARAGGPDADLQPVRQWFDILYSRMNLIRDSEVYEPLLSLPEFAGPYAEIDAFLKSETPRIDGTDAALRAELPAMAAELPELREMARRLTLGALAEFAARSEERRVGIQRTLIGLAVLTGLLVLAMGLLAGGLLRQYRRGAAQAREVEAARLRLQTILNTSADAVVVTNRGGWILEFNPAAERAFGYARDEVMGRNAMALFFPPELDEAQRLALARRAIETADGRIHPFRIELSVTRSDGARLPVEVAVAATGLGSGSVVVAFVRDISDRRRVEDAMREARDRALAGERAKADFIAVMSHEIRTPLNGLLGSLALLTDKGMPPDQRELVAMMRTSGRILLDHVNSVLDLSRAEAGAVAAVAPFDADRLMADCLRSQTALAAAAGNRMRLHRPAGRIGMVVGDAARLRQVLLNLLGNAVKFTRDGQITLEAERHPPGPGETEGQVEFRVIDTGIGIAEADLDAVFEDFVTLDTSPGRRAGGSGLGLAISRRLARSMGGSIGVESEPGEGSLFWLRLPLPAAGAPARPAEPGARGAAGTGEALSVLLVEDNQINRVLAARLVELAGHAVVPAEDGTQGLALAEARRFDVILTDISMPGLDGVELAARLRAGAGPSAGARILALTAHASEEDRARFGRAGIDDCLIKPVTEETLARALRAAAASLPPLADAGVLARLDGQLGPERMAEFVQRLEAEGEAALAALEARAGDRLAACHRLAGSAGSFGLLRLSERLHRLETALRAEEAALAAALAEDLPVLWRQSLGALAAALPRAGRVSPTRAAR